MTACLEHMSTSSLPNWLYQCDSDTCCPAGSSATTSAHTVQHKSAPDRRVLAEEHRRNISEAIKQKWADPQYRMRATSGMRGSVVQDKRAISVRVRLLRLSAA